MAVTARCVYAARTILGESPIWAGGRLLFVDIDGKKIFCLDPATGAAFTVETPEKVGYIVPVHGDPDRLVAGLLRSAVEVDLKARRVGRVLAETPEAHGTDEWRFNDGKCTPGGVILAGRMHLKWRENNPGKLYRLDLEAGAPGKFVEVLGEVGLPNGMCWDEAKRLMYYVDSLRASITAYPTDPQGMPLLGPGGSLEGQGRVVVQLEAGKSVPDGMTIDTDGNLWVALHGDGRIARFNPETGKELEGVAVPASRVTAPTFGGPDLATLYITCRIEEGEDAAKDWGGIFAAEVPGVRGVAPAFAAKIP